MWTQTLMVWATSARGARKDDFLDELAEPIEHRARVVRVDRRDAPGVAGVPRLQELERRAVAHLADEDAVGPVAHRGHDGVAPGVDLGLDEDLDLVLGLALELRGVLDDEDAVVGLSATSCRSALAKVVLPEPVPPPMRMLCVVAHGLGERVAPARASRMPLAT